MKHQIKDGDRLIATIETHGDAVVVVHEPAQPDCSHLVGKFLRAVESKMGFTKDSWYAMSEPTVGCLKAIDDQGCVHNFLSPENCFDLANPRDTNPDEEERVIPFSYERWKARDYVRVQTRNKQEVKQLTEFECIATPVVGVIEGHDGVNTWYKNGSYSNDWQERSIDLMLVVKGGDQ